MIVGEKFVIIGGFETRINKLATEIEKWNAKYAQDFMDTRVGRLCQE